MQDENDIGWWWRASVQGLRKASEALSMLLAFAEEHAGVDWESLQGERERRRGLLPEEVVEGAEAGCVGEPKSA